MSNSTNSLAQSVQPSESQKDLRRLQSKASYQYEYAGFIGRLFASLLDIIVAAMLLFIFVLLLLFLTPFISRNTIEVMGGILVFIVFPLYNIVCLCRFGTTLGKNVFGYKVISQSRRRPKIIRIILRETIGKYLSLSLLGIGFLWIIFEKKKQGWHDKILETYVIKDTQESLVKRVLIWLGTVVVLILIFFGTIKVNHLTGYYQKILSRYPPPVTTPSPAPQDNKYTEIMRTAWIKKDPQICKQIKEVHPRWNCVMEIGENLFTPDYCADVEEVYDRNLCLSDVAASQKDINICETVSDNFRKNYCYAGVAEALEDVTLCEAVSNIANLHETCIVEIGKKLKDVSYCEKVNNPEAKDSCYNAFATYILNDSSWCEKIVSSNVRSYCDQYAKPNPTQVARELEEAVTYCCKVKYLCPDGATVFTYIKNHVDNLKRLNEMTAGLCIQTAKRIPIDRKDYKDDKCTQEWNPQANCN